MLLINRVGNSFGSVVAWLGVSKMLKKPKPPCKGCEDRAVGCHSKCDTYSEFLCEQEKWNTERLKAKNAESNVATYEVKRTISKNKHFGNW